MTVGIAGPGGSYMGVALARLEVGVGLNRGGRGYAFG